MDQQKAIEDIALIKQMMEESRQFTIDNGKAYIFWGILVTVGVFMTYWAILNGKEEICGWIWIVTIGIGWLYSILIVMKERANNRTQTFGGRLVGFLWGGCGIAMTILGFVGPMSGAVSSWGITPVLASVVGIGYFLSSEIYKLKWVRLIGIAWWLGAILMFIVKGIHTLAIFGAMMVLFQVVPGIIFYEQWKKMHIQEKSSSEKA
ncbi:MAG: hypothetical protein ACP5US_07950 [Candidatus Kryptoniota bacterium]